MAVPKKKTPSALRQIFVYILTKCSAVFWNGRGWDGFLGYFLCISVRYQAPQKTLSQVRHLWILSYGLFPRTDEETGLECLNNLQEDTSFARTEIWFRPDSRGVICLSRERDGAPAPWFSQGIHSGQSLSLFMHSQVKSLQRHYTKNVGVCVEVIPQCYKAPFLV